MPKKIDQKKILERIIESHLKNIDYYLSIGKPKRHPLIVSEGALVERYLFEYNKYKPNNCLKYSGELLDKLKP